jgi:hexosaminidase
MLFIRSAVYLILLPFMASWIVEAIDSSHSGALLRRESSLQAQETSKDGNSLCTHDGSTSCLSLGGRPSIHSGIYAAKHHLAAQNRHTAQKKPMSLLSQKLTRGNGHNKARLPILPYPLSLLEHLDSAGFPIEAATIKLGQGVSEQDESVRQLRELVQRAGSGINKVQHINNVAEILLTIGGTSESNDSEGYLLEVQPHKVEITSAGAPGLFYGVQTLRQLIQKDGKIPSVSVRDAPRLKWRGLHLDVSRHFFNATHVKSLISTMASFKLNRFHWHLTDDQGWRLPVEDYPLLTDVGSESVTGKREFYTREEIESIIAHAKARHVEVVPEVDVPGHCAAAIAAYPELGNKDSDSFIELKHPLRAWGLNQYTLSPTDDTVKFLNSVFNQISSLFPSSLVHIGGDEAPTAQWSSSATAKKIDRPKTQSFFNEQVTEILRKKNRSVIAWDEAQHMAGLPKDAIIMAWRSIDELRTALEAGRHAVNNDQAKLYFDHYQGPEASEPKAICCYSSLSDVYNYDPVPSWAADYANSGHLLGAQAQLWSEYFPNWAQVEYMAFPRSLALAERLWTPNSNVISFQEFGGRLCDRLDDLDAWKINYRRGDTCKASE